MPDAYAGRRFWTEEERQILREWYGLTPTEAIADCLGRTITQIYNQAKKIGLARSVTTATPEHLSQVRELNARGWSDTEIAELIGAERHTISGWRNQMGLPSNSHSKRVRSKISQGVKRQCDRLGVKNMNEMRLKTWRDAARRLGWPDDLRLRHLQILEALYYTGPMTRRELADHIGMPWKGSRQSLTSNDPEGSYLAHLQARGLVVNLGRIRKGKGRGHSTCVYSVPIHVHPNPQPKELNHGG